MLQLNHFTTSYTRYTHFIKLTTNMYNDYIHNPQKINWPHQQNYIHLSKIYQLGFKILFAARWWKATYFFSGFLIVPAIYLVRLYLLSTATSKSDSSHCYWYKKLNKLISIDWYLFTLENHSIRTRITLLLKIFPLPPEFNIIITFNTFSTGI